MATGNTKPLRIITGPGAEDVWLDDDNPENGMIFAVVRPGRRRRTAMRSKDDSLWMTTSASGASSMTETCQRGLTIGGPNLLLKDGRGIALDPKNKDVIVSDKTLNAVLRFHVPEAF